MKYSSRFFLYAPLGVFLVLSVVTGAHWWIKASALSNRLDALNGREAMPGVTVSFVAKKITGFPFSLDTELSGFAVAVATANGPTRWRSEKFAVHALTYGRDETIFEAAGRQRLEWGAGRALDFAVGALRASAILHRGALKRFDLDLIGFGSPAFTAQRLQLHARKDGDKIAMFATAGGFVVRPPCGGDFRRELTVTAASALDPLLSGKVSLAAGLKLWRGRGGAVNAAATPAIAAENLPDLTALAQAFCPKERI